MVRLRSMISFMVAMATQIPNIYLWLRYLISLVAKSQDSFIDSQPGMSWKSAWKISTGDLIYRISLSDNGKASTSLRQSKTVDLCPRHYLIVETVKIEKFSRFIGAFFITRS